MNICLAGMHRSGTSLLSSYLLAAGIQMGEKLIGPAQGNLRGHFEDEDFVALHDEILRHNRSSIFTPARNLKVDKNEEARARALFEGRKAASRHWGWKDPRSTLFLEFWRRLAPDTRFVCLYREPTLVVDSLVRRSTDRRLKLMPWLGASAWLRYNDDILQFKSRHPDDCAIISIDAFNQKHVEAIQTLGAWLDYDFSVPYSTVYRSKEIKQADSRTLTSTARIVTRVYQTRFEDMLRKLNQAALIPLRE